MTSQLTPAETAVVLARRGKYIDAIADDTGLMLREVAAVCEKAGIGFDRNGRPGAIRPAAGPSPATPPDDGGTLHRATEQAARLADTHEIARVRRLAHRAHAALTALAAALVDDEEKAAARQEVARLQQQLAAARARLRGNTATTGSTAAVADDGQVNAAAVRAWAAAHDVPCPTRGRPPARVVQAYLAAGGKPA